MNARDLSRHSARLEHQRRKLHRARRELRSTPPEIRDSLHQAALQLAHAIQALDRHAGEQLRRETSRNH